MKLFLNKDCPHFQGVNAQDIQVEIIYTDDDTYGGVVPPSVPLLQFDNGVQLIGADSANTIFDEIRKQK